jgi:hypothetical protein
MYESVQQGLTKVKVFLPEKFTPAQPVDLQGVYAYLASAEGSFLGGQYNAARQGRR